MYNLAKVLNIYTMTDRAKVLYNSIVAMAEANKLFLLTEYLDQLVSELEPNIQQKPENWQGMDDVIKEFFDYTDDLFEK